MNSTPPVARVATTKQDDAPLAVAVAVAARRKSGFELARELEAERAAAAAAAFSARAAAAAAEQRERDRLAAERLASEMAVYRREFAACYCAYHEKCATTTTHGGTTFFPASDDGKPAYIATVIGNRSDSDLLKVASDFLVADEWPAKPDANTGAWSVLTLPKQGFYVLLHPERYVEPAPPRPPASGCCVS